MRIITTISGILGIILFILGLMSLMIELPYNHLFFIGSAILIIGITIPLLVIDKVRHNRKINNIIESYKGSQVKKQKTQKSKEKSKGKGMSNSPFRGRKSGLTWSGGNIKASGAKRGTRKPFLNKR